MIIVAGVSEEKGAKRGPLLATRQRESALQKCVRRGMEVTAKVLDHYVTTFITSIITIYALFGDDIRLAMFRSDYDDIFDILTTASLVVFSVEILLSTAVKPNYFMGFFFVLDFVSTITMLLDLSYIARELFFLGDTDVEGGNEQG